VWFLVLTQTHRLLPAGSSHFLKTPVIDTKVTNPTQLVEHLEGQANSYHERKRRFLPLSVQVLADA